ncbi:MAG: hypothetical protein PVJ07_07770, partial [Anaerolineales bacterium]
MKSIESVDPGKLKWKQTRFAVHEFKLRSGEDLVGEMYWTEWLSDRAVAECADGCWHMDRPDFFRHRVVVREQGTGKDIAIFEKNWFGEGRLIFADGHSYEWFRTKAFWNHWALATAEDEVVFEIRDATRWFKHQADVVLHSAAEVEKELPLLILIGWYLVVMAIQDSAAVV